MLFRSERGLLDDHPPVAAALVDTRRIPQPEEVVGTAGGRVEEVEGPWVDRQFLEPHQLEVGLPQQPLRRIAEDADRILDDKGVFIIPDILANSGGVIVRQVTFQNPNKDVSTANVTIFTSNDGNASNVVVAAAALGNLSAVGKFQDMTIASPFNLTTSITGNNSQALFLKVGTAVSDGTVDIRVYGDVVSF